MEQSTRKTEPGGHFLASARRFRPVRFDEVLGQSHVVRSIRGAFVLGRVAPAYLFAGPRGVGKTTVARLIAKALNCTRRQGPDPCNVCDACVSINRSTCIDVREIDAASHTGVDNMRDVCETVRYPPTAVAYKVYIIDECHMLSKGAFNAFLKTLEEPPSHVVFILATTEPEKVPDTVKSRCQQFRFAPARPEEIVASLNRVLEARGDLSLSGPQRQRLLQHLAKAADGSFRDALSLLDQVVAIMGSEGDVQAALDVLGVTPWAVLEELADTIVRGDAAGALAAVDRHLRAGIDPRQLVEGLADLFRAIMVQHISPALDELTPLERDALAKVKTHAKTLPLDHILRCIDLFWAAMERFRQQVDQRTVVEVALVKACSLGQTIQLPQLIERLAALERGAARSVGKQAARVADPRRAVSPGVPGVPAAEPHHRAAPEPRRPAEDTPEPPACDNGRPAREDTSPSVRRVIDLFEGVVVDGSWYSQT